MKVLVTGGGGYIGSVLTGELVKEGHDVTVLDRFFFGRDVLSDLEDKITIVKGDTRWFDSQILKGKDAVVDMAALSNDPAGELDKEKTLEINYRARARMARLAKKYKVKRYVLASSCSGYGFQKEIATERSKLNPLTTYGRANVLWERAVFPLSDRHFSVTALRQSSVYGFSRRMRFDLAVNNMVLGLYKNGKLPILRNGKQSRPFIHIKDTVRAFMTVLNADPEIVRKQIFNVGSNKQNFQIFDLAKLVARSMGVPFKYEWYGLPDFRSYVVSFDKIHDVLGYRTRYTPKEGAIEILKALKSGKLKDDEKTVTVKWYKRLMEMQQVLRDVELDGKIL